MGWSAAQSNHVQMGQGNAPELCDKYFYSPSAFLNHCGTCHIIMYKHTQTHIHTNVLQPVDAGKLLDATFKRANGMLLVWYRHSQLSEWMLLDHIRSP